MELEDVGERLLRQQLLVGEAFERLDDLSAGGRLLGHGQVAFADLASLEADDVDDGLEQELGGLVDRGPGHVEAQSCLESTTTQKSGTKLFQVASSAAVPSDCKSASL